MTLPPGKLGRGGTVYELHFTRQKEAILMGQFFSDRVETALKYIYYDLRAGQGQEGLSLIHI